MKCIKLTKLSSTLAVNRHRSPVIGPGDISVLAQSNHRLNGECHARLALANSLVFGVVRDIWRTMENAIDAMSNVRTDNTAATGLCVLLDDVAKLAEQSPWLNQLDGFLQALARRLHDTDRVGIGLGPVAHVVCLVQVTMETLMVESDVKVDDVAVQEDALVRNSMANDLVD